MHRFGKREKKTIITFRFYYSFRILNKFHWSLVGETISCNEAVDGVCFRSGNDVLEDLGMPEVDILPMDIAGLGLLVIFYHLMAFLMLRWRLTK